MPHDVTVFLAGRQVILVPTYNNTNLHSMASFESRRWDITVALALYPGLLTRTFITCSNNMGEGLVNWSRAVTYLDVGWTRGVAHSQINHKQVSALPTANTDHGTTQCLRSCSLGDASWVQKAALQLYRRSMPLLHTSTQHPGTSLHMINFTSVSIASHICWEIRPGYEVDGFHDSH